MQTRAFTPDEKREFEKLRAAVAYRFPEIAHMVLTARGVAAPGLGTWASDKEGHIYMDPEVPWTPKERVGAMAHETLHILMRHFDRAPQVTAWREKVNAGISPTSLFTLANLAGDAEINPQVLKLGMTLPANHVTPENLGVTGERMEEYLDQLIRRAKVKPSTPQGGKGGSQGKSGDDSSSNSSGGTGNDQSNVSGPPQRGKELHDPSAPQHTSCSPATEDMSAQAHGIDPVPAEELDMALDATAAKINEEAKRTGGIGSKFSKAFTDWAAERLAPPEADLFGVFVSRGTSAIQSKAAGGFSTWQKPSRRSHGLPKTMLMPGMKSYRVRVILAGDVSGSMSDGHLTRAASEIVPLAGDPRVEMSMFSVSNHRSDITLRPVHAGSDVVFDRNYGGTDMVPAFEFADEQGCDVFILFSDCEVPRWPETIPRGIGEVIICMIQYPGQQNFVLEPPSWAEVHRIPAASLDT